MPYIQANISQHHPATQQQSRKSMHETFSGPSLKC
jgi:hypothetical protein